MEAITVHAHFDGEKIVLDEPYELEPNARLLVTVLPEQVEREHNDWAALSASGLAGAYGEDEPAYELTFVKEPNPEYEGR